MNRNDRFVVRHPNGWAIKAAHNPFPEGVYSKQSQAEAAAKQTVNLLGGGEVRIQGRNAKWRDSDTVPPGRDPFPPRDTRR